MNNDLSLSQTLGGLRIANPDDELPETPEEVATRIETSTSNPLPSIDPEPIPRDARSTTDTQSQSRRHSIFNVLRRGDSPGNTPTVRSPTQRHDQLYPNHRSDSGSSEATKSPGDPSARFAAAKAYRQSMPPNHQTQQQALSPYQSSNGQTHAHNSGQGYPAGDAPRPLSGVYAAHPPPNAIPTREPGSHRMRSEGMKPMPGVPSRSDSRGGAVMPAGVPSRESSHRERAYSQIHPLPAGNGPLPARRNSRGTGGGHTDGPGSSERAPPRYDADGKLLTSPEEWKDKGAASGIRSEFDERGREVQRQVKKGVRDFSFGRLLGEGSYSNVVLATDKATLKEYAVKILDKKHIIKEKKIKYVNIEKDTLNRLIEHPGIVRLYYTFQDSTSLYYVLDIASGGELLGVLKKIGSFDVECTRFYGAQILDAIEHMHNRGVIHRDLKPENVLLDDQMHIKITDFGTAKLLPDPRKPRDSTKAYDPTDAEEDESTRAKSFVGTAEYVSPELLTDKSACKASDLWAFGCIIYQLLTGRPPFKASNEYQTFQKIVALQYEFPPGFPPAARDLIDRLLVLDPQRRLSLEHIKNHEFFDGIQWGRGLWRQKAPRLKPYVPPTQAPQIIKLGEGYSSAPPPISTSRGPPQPSPSNGNARPQPRVITELPPPTQLDIEWSPVLTRSNERILKLGNMMVLSTPLPHSPNSRNGDHGESHEKKGGIARFFGGSTTKKRQRLVMVTSSGRIIFAASGGDDKRTKSEISLLGSECSWRTQIDAKGQEVWCVNTHGTHYTFEDAKSSVIGDPSKTSAQEWLESLERAKDIALSQSMVGSYNTEAGYDMSSALSSPNGTLGEGNNVYQDDRSGRNHLTKSQASLGDGQGEKPKKNRFSKRQSKNGLGSTPF